MILKRRLLGIDVEEYWFDHERYRRSTASVVCLRTAAPEPLYDCLLPEKTLAVDLSRTEEELLRNVYPRFRSYVRNLDGTYLLRTANTAADRDLFFTHYLPFARERRIPVPDPGEEGSLEIYLAFGASGGLLQGTAFLPLHEAGVYRYRYGVTIERTHANVLIFWQALCAARKRGYRWFDLGGFAEKPGKGSALTGINEFKSRFGGAERDIYFYIRSPRQPLRMMLRLFGRLLANKAIYRLAARRLTHGGLDADE